MAGIYIHIPFCKQACNYCNFHFSTSLQKKEDFLAALQKEIVLQKDYLQGEKIETVYFGGGTPSILSATEIQRIFESINAVHDIAEDAEITLEANPDDLSREKLLAFRQTPINRFSIGIQSFFEEDLQFMHRAHNAEEASRSIKTAQDVGFQNLTIDLIYGTPTMDNEHWIQNLDKATQFDIPHISSYCLTVEPKTLLEKQVKKGILKPVDDEKAAEQFEILIENLTEKGFEHYEISNFAKPDCHARHNSNYWLGKKYLGLGPSAHAYDGISRQHNIANNSLYIASLQQGILNFEKENLSSAERYNEYVLVALRTKWGAHASEIKKISNEFWLHFQAKSKPFIEKNQILANSDIFTLSKEGKMLADFIAIDLFY